ncbi:MAG: hypothetical protein B6I36_09705 [Desulfobacteraceae bacterium 4572_35.1]|nr:MAG: hypothetical protein B6I36_09705 [Desulfobacteraceae bacterium 4572_35.1]
MSGLQTLFRNDFPDQQQLLLKLLGDVEALYRGEWQQWQRCQVAYHNINHIHAVTMVAMQIYAGECERYQRAVRTDQIKVLAAAALFHDCGYLKAVGDDSKGSGGQYTFEHVERSQRLVWDYLKTQQGWTQSERRAVVAAIGKTKIVNVDEQQHLAEPVFADLGDMLASADLLAQVADENYLDRLPLLYILSATGFCLGCKNLEGARTLCSAILVSNRVHVCSSC